MSGAGYERLLKDYLDWPRQAREGFTKGVSTSLPQSYTNVDVVVVCGMGGSGIVGDYVRSLSSRYGGSPIFVVKSYKLPSWVARTRSLIAAVSYSGNTVETLGCYEDAKTLGLPRLVITSGGKLLEAARRDGVPAIVVEKTAAARAALASMFYGLLGVLKAAGLVEIPQSEIDASIKLLDEALRKVQTLARDLAQALHEKIPVFLCHVDYEPLCWRFKNEFNENAKVQCKVETAPEWGHNDVEGWCSPVAPEKHHAVILDPIEKGSSEILRIVRSILEQTMATTVIELQGSGMLSKMMFGSLVAGLASIELAKAKGVDPLETALIKRYRAELERLQLGG